MLERTMCVICDKKKLPSSLEAVDDRESDMGFSLRFYNELVIWPITHFPSLDLSFTLLSVKWRVWTRCPPSFFAVAQSNFLLFRILWEMDQEWPGLPRVQARGRAHSEFNREVKAFRHSWDLWLGPAAFTGPHDTGEEGGEEPRNLLRKPTSPWNPGQTGEELPREFLRREEQGAAFTSKHAAWPHKGSCQGKAWNRGPGAGECRVGGFANSAKNWMSGKFLAWSSI